tara:strand:- start:152 stop:646 length:495 start_codon:yes stop_codon:yes gene_type:complete
LNITRFIKKKFIRLFLIATLFPLQSCSNTLFGEKLENSFDNTLNSTISSNSTKVKVKSNLGEIKKSKSSKKDNEEEIKIVQENIIKNNLTSNKDRLSQKSTKSTNKVIFTPQPYRIILKLSGANPSAPAETVTNALRKAGVEFEVEKIERFDEKNLSNDSSFKR